MKKLSCKSFLIVLILFVGNMAFAQYPVFRGNPVTVDFSKKLRTWDGFGFNYVETAQTIDYSKDAKDYGGFSIMTEDSRKHIVDLVFGEEGLKVGLVKMFLDPFHQTEAGGKFNHEMATANMRMFVRMGLEKTRARSADLQIITTLYGPPAYTTLQKTMRGRDLDPKYKTDLANYMIDWAKFLKEKEKFPIKYISLHNEGEDWERWPWDGKEGNIGKGHDYNMYWPGELICDFLKIMPPMLAKAGLKDVSVTNGEPTNWYRFSFWGHSDALYDDEAALKNLGIITSHGFYVGGYENRWYGSHTGAGVAQLRSKRPELHAWVTSTSWSKMDSRFVKEIWGNIYEAQVNGLIPWAGIQRPPLWVGGDPNPGSAINVNEDGTYEVRPGYYFYKQVSRAGQPGMAVARVNSMDSEIPVIAFSANGTKNADAFVVVNTNLKADKPVVISVKGSIATKFKAFRTGNDDRYKEVGTFDVNNGEIIYNAPMNSATTFFATE
jgi:O-glycosyl hydrolase